MKELIIVLGLETEADNQFSAELQGLQQLAENVPLHILTWGSLVK
jgi:hypothetical protein